MERKPRRKSRLPGAAAIGGKRYVDRVESKVKCDVAGGNILDSTLDGYRTFYLNSSATCLIYLDTSDNDTFVFHGHDYHPIVGGALSPSWVFSGIHLEAIEHRSLGSNA